jgi:hypothetical protein
MTLEARHADRFVEIVLGGIEREYPNHVSLSIERDGDLAPPRELTPAFHGCFDWHSAVHSHWTLVRLRRVRPDAEWRDAVDAVLDRRLSSENLAAEQAFLAAERNRRFECPYGLAWLLQLAAELLEGEAAGCARSATLRARLEPLEQLARARLLEWVTTLPFPVRSGQHPQSALAMGLAFDWARTAGDAAFAQELARRARDFHEEDRDAPLAYEPSGWDFVSPCLAEADLLRRVMQPDEFASWLRLFLPDLAPESGTSWLRPVTCPDGSDGKLSHLNGLNLSRAWMLDGIAHGLPDNDPLVPPLLATAAEHGSAGLPSVTAEHYAGAHWLPTFATYLLTRRGIAASA